MSLRHLKSLIATTRRGTVIFPDGANIVDDKVSISGSKEQNLA